MSRVEDEAEEGHRQSEKQNKKIRKAYVKERKKFS